MASNGWATLGEVMGAAPALRQNAFNQGEMMALRQSELGTRQSDLLARARMIRDRSVAAQALPRQLMGLYNDPVTGKPYTDPSIQTANQGNVIATALAAGYNPVQVFQAEQAANNVGRSSQIWNTASGPNADPNKVNILNMAMSGKPVDLTKESGGVVFNPMQTPNTQAINPTQVGMADIGLKRAQAGEAGAQANAANAHARLFDVQAAAGGFNPGPGGAMGAGIPPPTNDPKAPHGNTYLQSLPGNLAAQVKALSDGRMQFPSGYALKSPYWQQMLSAVAQYDPSFDAVNYNARASTRRDFTSGKSAQQINALNTAIGHLQTLSNSADTLGNTSIPAINSIGNWLSTQSGNPKVNNFDTTRKAVVDELTRVWRGTGGSEKDIETWTKSLNDAGSPGQLHGAIAQIGELLQSKINSLANTYNQGMGTTSQPTNFITPQASKTLDMLEQRAGVSPPSDVTTSAPGVGSLSPSGASTPIPRPTTQADFDALPSGSVYIDPDDGKTYRKP